MDRRAFLGNGAAALAVAAAGAGCDRNDPASVTADDCSGLESVRVERIARPASTAQAQAVLAATEGPVSIAGAGFSMGGQTLAPGSLHLDMRELRRVVWFKPGNACVRVQAGMRWRDLQDVIDPHDLSIKVMQSYSNFSVGGSISVNCHGRYVGVGPVAGTVRALQLVDAGGQVRELSRQHEPALFSAVLGGYGGLGVVTEVELDLAQNERIERRVERIALDEYPAFFGESIAADPAMVLHNADLLPPRFDAPLSIGWRRSEAALTEPARLVPRDLDYGREQTMIWSATELPRGEVLRDKVLTERLLREPAVVLRNHEASLDTRSLEPRTRKMSHYLLQEYFVPVNAFAPFVRELRRILAAADANVPNVSIRHSPLDPDALLRWAPAEMFSFVLFLKQRSWRGADARTGRWTRRLVDAALAHGGRYYLPYRPHATVAQFRRAYPEHAAFSRIKASVDPGNRFRNRMWDKYLAG